MKRACKWCKTMFVPKNRNHVFCSNECREEYYKDLLLVVTNEKKRIGECEVCGHSWLPALHFHHYDPSTKLFNVSWVRAKKRQKSEIEAEMAKCVMLCVNCHIGVHTGQPGMCDKVEVVYMAK